MTGWQPLLTAVLGGGAVAVWLWLPGPAQQRLDQLVPARAAPAAGPGPSTSRRQLQAVPGVLAPLLVRSRARFGRRRRQQRERDRAVEACDVLAAELRAGRSAAAALDAAAAVAVGPAGHALRCAAGAASFGGEVPAALASGTGSAVPELLRGLAACWAVCASTGSGLAASVERLGAAQRTAAEQRRAVEVELAAPRATARLLAMLPVVGLLMASGLGAAPVAFLLGSPVGRVCLLLGLGLEVVGLRWTARLARRAAGG